MDDEEGGFEYEDLAKAEEGIPIPPSKKREGKLPSREGYYVKEAKMGRWVMGHWDPFSTALTVFAWGDDHDGQLG